MSCKERLSHLWKSIHMSNMICPFEGSWYIFQIISAYSLLSAKPWHHQDLEGKEINNFTRSTNFLLAWKAVPAQVITVPGLTFSRMAPVLPDVCSCLQCHEMLQHSRRGRLHHPYLCCAMRVSPCEQICTRSSQTYYACCFSFFPSLF